MYIIKKIPKNDILIDDPLWQTAEVAEIKENTWNKFDNIPDTKARLLYSEEGITVNFTTNEKPLIARYKNKNDPVCNDSCVEFFIRPDENDNRYINFEFNSLGTMFLAVRTGLYDPFYPKYDKTYFKVKDFVDDKLWIHQFTVPFSFIEEIFGKYTNNMYGNLYKCCGEGKTEHYASFYPIYSEEINFHQSKFFGEFLLE